MNPGTKRLLQPFLLRRSAPPLHKHQHDRIPGLGAFAGLKHTSTPQRNAAAAMPRLLCLLVLLLAVAVGAQAELDSVNMEASAARAAAQSGELVW
jgi:hypothetical protein